MASFPWLLQTRCAGRLFADVAIFCFCSWGMARWDFSSAIAGGLVRGRRISVCVLSFVDVLEVLVVAWLL